MDISTAAVDLGPLECLLRGEPRPVEGRPGHRHAPPPDVETLRAVAWEIGERKPGDAYTPPNNHVGLAMVHPFQGFAYWRVLDSWVEATARQRGPGWAGSRLVLRLYDVSAIEFTGLNAHRVQDEDLPGLVGHRFFNLPGAGTWQLAEVGFLLRDREFIPAARSPVVPFGSDSPSRHVSHEALLVLGGGRVEPVGNVWDQERELRDRRRPTLRHPLRIAAFALASRASGQSGPTADFVAELARGQRALGHEVHVFVPASEQLPADREVEGVAYHALPDVAGDSPLEVAEAFAWAAEERLSDLPEFDLLHLHEWMAATGRWVSDRPAVLSLSSLESTRAGGPPANAISRRIAEVEREAARSVRCVLTPAWLRDRAETELKLGAGKVHPFAMEGRVPNEWEAPLDFGQVKMSVGVGPLDRMILFIGPLEHAAGVDLLVEAMPVLLQRAPNLRVAFVGTGPMWHSLERRARDLGVAHAVRLLGHQEGAGLNRLLRSAEALVLPSRYRIAMDDAVIDLARKAGRPVVTTHAGPAYLVRHEENGLITYDNPGSMVWALDRILGDPAHTAQMGENGRQRVGNAPRWNEVAALYLDGCVHWFPELSVRRM